LTAMPENHAPRPLFVHRSVDMESIIET